MLNMKSFNFSFENFIFEGKIHPIITISLTKFQMSRIKIAICTSMPVLSSRCRPTCAAAAHALRTDFACQALTSALRTGHGSHE